MRQTDKQDFMKVKGLILSLTFFNDEDTKLKSDYERRFRVLERYFDTQSEFLNSALKSLFCELTVWQLDSSTNEFDMKSIELALNFLPNFNITLYYDLTDNCMYHYDTDVPNTVAFNKKYLKLNEIS